jgi:hypothetical protein
VERGSGTYYEITVRPAVDFTRLEEVLVVTTPPPAITAEQIAKEAEVLRTAPRSPDATPGAGNLSPQNASPRKATPRPATPGDAAPRRPAPPVAPQNGAPSEPTPVNGSPRGPA